MPNTDSKTYLVNDQPTERDALDFTPYVETLADIIQTGNTPLTIGVFGGWGSGKTSLMRMVKNQLPDDFTIAWFDAWKYDKEETLWRAFLLNVLFAVEQKSGETEELKTLKTMLYRGLELEKTGGVTIDLAKLGAKVAEGAIQIGLSFIPPLATLADMAKELQKSGKGSIEGGFESAIQRERTKIYVEQVRSLEQFQEKFATLIKSYISPQRLVVFVDDLDRCLPEKAIQVLEAIKLFLDVQNCVFVLGIDQDVIARGIEMKYKDVKDKKDSDGRPHFTIEGIKYLEKIIQLPFQIPPVIQDDMGKFVEGLSGEWAHEDCHKVFAEGLGDNPRNIKRTVNTFLMLSKLAEKRKEKLKDAIKPIRLAKVVAIQAAHPDLFNLLLKEEPRYLRELEEYYLRELQESMSQAIQELARSHPDDFKEIAAIARKVQDEAQGTETKQEKPVEIAMKLELPPALVPFLSQRGSAAVRRILTMKHKPETKDANFAGLSTDELKLYFTLTRSAESPQAAPPAEAARLVFEPQMVRILAGNFLMGSTPEQIAQAINNGADKNWVQNETPQHTVELSEYSIGKYPINNREYQSFVREAKYNPPRSWDGDQFPAEKGSHPVVNVSWEDANAYCKWLGEKTKKNYRLPTEAEWEKAARGEDGRVYPWGNDFDPKKTNTSESNIGATSDVGKFSPQGDSPYGCADMAGNVWEWTSSLFKGYPYHADDGREDMHANGARVLRGSSFVNHYRYAHCASRHVAFGNDVGFRVASSPPKVEFDA
ncbi:MAG TPA: SUMF1/EgtB/PvdO family nonheme iron enzyme [Anaerolineales bacterium]|nr:SUMF1/EgtB/PvdO family nonheme iron enzyme [Anaerolineales bacterium]